MPKAFDVQKYEANYDPISGGTFVSVQDVMSATSQMWGQVLTTMLDVIPKSGNDILPLIEQGLPQLIQSILSWLGANPYGTTDTPLTLDGSVNTMLGWIDDTTGLDLLGMVIPLENLLSGKNTDLLTGLLGWLTPFSSGSTGLWGDGIFGQGLPAYNLTGTAPPNVFDLIPIGSLTNVVSPNMFSDPIFDLSTPFFGGNDWTLDTPTNSPEANAGSAMVVADSTEHELFSNPLGVAAKQQVSVTISTMYTGLASTGTPIQLLIEQYLRGTRLDAAPIMLASIASGTSDSGGWRDLSGTYTTPVGVDEIRVVLHIDPTATAGTIHFSAGNWTKAAVSELIPADLVEGLTNGFQVLDGFVQQGLDTIHQAIDGGGAVNVWLTDVSTAISDWWNDTQVTAGQASDASSDISGTITNMWQSWFNTTAPAATPAQVATTIGAIRVSVAGGFTLQTFTSSNHSYTVPSDLLGAAEFYIVTMGGGQKGTDGWTATGTNYPPGLGGGYTCRKIDPATLTATLDITVGAGGTASVASGASSVKLSNGTSLCTSVNAKGAISSVQGYLPSDSIPAAGGSGGSTVAQSVTANNGFPGGDSVQGGPGGAGGIGSSSSGANVVGGQGGAGGNGITNDVPMTGGSGGGGGGAGATGGFAQAIGGTGGLGGFPGGGGGGGGAANGFSNVAGPGGNGGNGIVALIYR